MPESVLVWFRRDLRDDDHTALSEALRRARRVHCAFVFDREILDPLPSRADRRVEFIRESLVELDAALRRRGGGLIVRYAEAAGEIPRLAKQLGVDAVFCNRDYEPKAKARDVCVADVLAGMGIGFESFKDQALFDGAEVLTQAGKPYTVFTPYRKAWLKRLRDDDLMPMDCRGGKLSSEMLTGVPTLAEVGFERHRVACRSVGLVPGMAGARQRVEDFRLRLPHYADRRDFPALTGTSGLSVHLRFGTVSIRELVSLAIEQGASSGNAGAASWLSELVWRDFYFMILDRFPHVVDAAFKPEYGGIEWERGEAAERLFAAWCEGRTGYPLVDAAMRQLNRTGEMHNRLRMVVASFLCKDLGVDWRRGEAYFACHLNDFDLSANNGGWQWAASSGCDAQPYFRIFNPVTQSERFDPQGHFIRRHLPELAGLDNAHIHAPWRMSPAEQRVCGVVVGGDGAYPSPIVEHDAARRRTLERYAVVKSPRCSAT